ncbi:MAG: HEAT repeat domain-containing protein, partial [Armatimonadetes bacterium]|nr:HEAT repeat domain-containing protein [Armatimonadota bacterium]
MNSTQLAPAHQDSWLAACRELALEPVVSSHPHRLQARCAALIPERRSARCTISPHSAWVRTGRKLFGWMQSGRAGPLDDCEFHLSGMDAEQVRALWQAPGVREGFQMLPRAALTISDHLSAFQVLLPEDLDAVVLSFSARTSAHVGGAVMLLHRVLEMVAPVSARGSRNASASLELLRTTPRRVWDGVTVFWDEVPAFRQATEAVGRARRREAAVHLMRLLANPDLPLRLRAIRALGEIQAPAAIRVLIPELGEGPEVAVDGERLADAAAVALRALGQEDAPAAFHALLQGDATGYRSLSARNQEAMREGVRRGLHSSAAEWA